MTDKHTNRKLTEEEKNFAADGRNVVEGCDPPTDEELKEAWNAARNDSNSGS